jgi:glutamate/tyrosine decarboxylase-like PLP-dependent enzyme
MAPQGLDAAIADFQSLIAPHAVGNPHPRFFGWVHGAGTPTGILAEAAAAALNANCGGRDHAPIEVEWTVIDWFRRLFDLPEEAGGVLVAGTSMANLLGLAVARNSVASTIRETGQNGLDLVGYASDQGHACLSKAFEMMGLGRQALRLIPTGANFRMDMDRLAQTIAADRAAGKTPFVVVAPAGTVNTGAVDDLRAIADLCDREGIWMHVDGAFGALAALSPELKPLVQGIERARSIAFDLHKWLHVPYDCGALVVRDRAQQIATFGGRPDYLTSGKGLSGGMPWPADLGIDLSRGFRALKVWFTVKEHGFERLGQSIAQTCALARSFHNRIESCPELETMAPAPLNIVVLRRRFPGLDPETEDRLNADLVAHLQTSGVAAPSTCRIGGRLCIRVAIVNHRTTERDLDILLDGIRAFDPNIEINHGT